VKGFVFGRYQIWRVFTSFFHGGTGVLLLMNAYMLCRHIHMLETTTYRERSSDFGWQLLLCSVAIYLLSIPFSAILHHDQLVICLTYLPSVMDPERRLDLFGMIPMRQKHLPLILAAVYTWGRGWKVALPLSLVGMIVGHLWFLLEHTPYLRKRTKRPALVGIQGLWDRISQPPDWFSLHVVGRGTPRAPRGRAPNAPVTPLGPPAWRYDRMPGCSTCL